MKRTVHRTFALVALSIVAVAATACSTSTTAATTTSTSSPRLSGSITVSAASSLTETFTTLATSFRLLHPSTSVTFNFGSSGALATQITSGAPADVFASASPSDMTTVQAAHLVSGTPVIFARNRLEIVVKPGNPLGIHSLADLTKADVVALCVSTAPCGSTAQEALTKAGVTLATSKVSLGANVDATLAQVTTGDADAAIVYVTNAATVGAQGVAVPIPPSQNVSTSYPIAVLTTTSNRSLASAWVAYVVGPIGRAALLRAHFLPPG
jgi:molybdate transport system substrate-binding protein